MAEEDVLPSSLFRCPPPFDLGESQTKRARWEKWIRRFKHYLRATVNNHTDDQAKHLFLNLVGDEVEDLLITFPPAEISTYKGLIKCLTDDFSPQRNVDYER